MSIEQQQLYDISAEIASHFNVEGDITFGKELLLHLALFIRKRKKSSFMQSLQHFLADVDDENKKHLQPSASLEEIHQHPYSLWEVQWIREYIWDFPVDSHPYTLEEAISALMESGYDKQAQTISTTYGQIRLSVSQELYDILAELAVHFNAEGDMIFGRELLLRLVPYVEEQGELILTTELRHFLVDIGEKNEPLPELSLNLEERLEHLRTSWEVEWIRKYVASLIVDEHRYTVDEAIAALLKSGYAEQAKKINTFYGYLRYIERFRFIHNTLTNMLPRTSTVWFHCLYPELLKDVCIVVGIDGSTAFLDEIHNAVGTVETADLLFRCDKTILTDIRKLTELIAYHCRRPEYAEQINETLTELAGKEYDNVFHAAKEFLKDEVSAEQQQLVREKMMEVLMEQGLCEDYETYLAGTPLEDIMI